MASVITNQPNYDVNRRIQRKGIYYPKLVKNINYPLIVIFALLILVLLISVILNATNKTSSSIFLLILVQIYLFVHWMICCNGGRAMCMNLFQYLCTKCCCSIDFISTKTTEELIKRYQEEEILSKEDISKIVSKHPFLNTIIEKLYTTMPEFFFSFLLTGSLREGLGKPQPSTSVLASDFDIMLIPDCVRIGKAIEDFKDFKDGIPIDLDDSNEIPDDIPPVFIVFENCDTEFVWLKLQEEYFQQWEGVCPRRQFDKPSRFLSSKLLTNYVKNVILSSSDLKNTAAKKFNLKPSMVQVSADNHGPALNIKVTATDYSIINILGSRNLVLFEADFTLALHCPFWPKDANDFFDNVERRSNWPSPDVVNKIRSLGCHVAPKASSEKLVKLVYEQVEYTTFAQSSYLEWRYSFSQAEVLLADQLPQMARSAFLAFKAINKRHFNCVGEKIPSYALKCILFSLVEAKGVDYWILNDPDSITKLFLIEMLQEFRRRLKRKHCPDFWIPKINLFNIFNDLTDEESKTFEEKLKLVKDVIRNPNHYVGDGFLEIIRFYRQSCCYFGEYSYEEDIETLPLFKKIRKIPKYLFKCSYNDENIGRNYDPVGLEVY